MLRLGAAGCLVAQNAVTTHSALAQCPCGQQLSRQQGRQQWQSSLHRHRQRLQGRSTSCDAPALGMQRQRQQQPQTETGGDGGGGGGWGWGGGSGGQPPQRGGSGGGGDDPEDGDGTGEPVSNPFQRVAMSIRARQMACPWFLWRLAAAAATDVLAVLVVNHAAQPGKLTQPSEAVLSQVLVTLLNALAVGFAMEPFSHRVRSELLVVRSDGGLAAASRPLRWSHAQLGSGRPGGPALLARRLLCQGLQLGLVGLLTGLAGSAAARQLASWRRDSEAKELQGPGGPDGSTGAALSGSGGQAAGRDAPRLHAMDILKRSALQRVLFMALSANVRHAALYAAEDRLCMSAGTPAVLLAARALLHSFNSLLAAAQWQRVSSHIYSDTCRQN